MDQQIGLGEVPGYIDLEVGSIGILGSVDLLCL
jgi:hypothetical protein